MTIAAPIGLVRYEMHEMPSGILVVDDEPSIRTSLSVMLAEFGYPVRCAVDGFSALREIRQEIPEILLSDLHMPAMSGFELLLVVRRRYPAIQVIAMSGAFSGSEVPSGIPADAFYQKGSSMAALLHIFREMPRMKRRLPVEHRTVSPLWIRRIGIDPSGMAFVVVSCSECLRSFPQALEDKSPHIHEVECIHCGSLIPYEIVDPSDRIPPQASYASTRGAIVTKRASTLSN